MTQSGSAITVDCFVRVSQLIEPVDTNIKALKNFEQRGLIDELDVTGWPDEIALTDGPTDAEIIAHYERFRTWADRHGVSLQPAFTQRDRTTLVSDTAETVLVLPVVCLVIHIDGRLVSVVPHSTETTTYTIEKALADLETLDPDCTQLSPLDDTIAEQPARSTSYNQIQERCPECDMALIVGQSLYVCPVCGWTTSNLTGFIPEIDADTEALEESGEKGHSRSNITERSHPGDTNHRRPQPQP